MPAFFGVDVYATVHVPVMGHMTFWAFPFTGAEENLLVAVVAWRNPVRSFRIERGGGFLAPVLDISLYIYTEPIVCKVETQSTL